MFGMYVGTCGGARKHLDDEAGVPMNQAIYLLLSILSFGVAAFGVVMLKIAYDLEHPFEFIMVFFAACLVIMIGGALCVGFAVRSYTSWKGREKNIP